MALALLPIVAAVGFLKFMTWLGGRGIASSGEPPEQRFPGAVVAAHGLFAVATLLSVLIALIA